jgi:hypothetical protein
MKTKESVLPVIIKAIWVMIAWTKGNVQHLLILVLQGRVQDRGAGPLLLQEIEMSILMTEKAMFTRSTRVIQKLRGLMP